MCEEVYALEGLSTFEVIVGISGISFGFFAAVFSGLTLFYRFWDRRLIVNTRIIEDSGGRLEENHLQVIITNATGALILLEDVFIELRPGERMEHDARPSNLPKPDNRRIFSNGAKIIVRFQLMYLAEALLQRGNSGTGKVSFVIVDAKKRRKRRIRIPDLERWARDEIVRD